MSDFETKMGMPPEQWDDRMQDLKASCECSKCPSLKGSGQNYAKDMMPGAPGGSHMDFFCYDGLSDRIIPLQGCICSTCSLKAKMGLKHEYFCKQDSELRQRGITIFDPLDDLFGDV